LENRSGRVSKQIIVKLSAEPPTREEVLTRLKTIAEEFDVAWEPNILEQEESMPAIIAHKNEYTIEFDSKPFGMNWTPTEDGKNLWVSSIAPKSPAATKGVIPGSLLIAFNGSEIKDLGSKAIFQKSSSLGLPLRITFCKPGGSIVPTNDKDMSVDSDVVNKCVGLLKDPQCWEWSDKQREDLCKKQGANAAEVAAALFLAKYMMENANQKPAVSYQTMNADMNAFPGPSNSDFPDLPNPSSSGTEGPSNGYDPSNAPGSNPSDGGSGGSELEDLEKRFAKLKTGL